MTSKHISFSQSKLPTDVEIIIFDKTYHLHSTILRQFPGFFDAGLSSTWWKEENTINGPGSIKYSYELLPDEGGDLMLLPVGPSEQMGSVLAEKLGDFKISSETPNTDKPKPKANKGLVQAYDNLFRVLYHRRWDGYPGITDCQKLVEVADLYCCLSAVVQRVEDALLSTPDISFDLVRQAPYFVDLAAKVRSKRLFHDTFVHLVGNWRSWRQRSRSPIQDEVERLANLEYIRICEMTIEVDRELISMSGSGKRPMWPIVHAVIRRGLKEWLTGRSTSGGKEGVLYKRLLQVSFTSTREDVKNQAAIHSSYSVGDLESALESSTNSIRRIISPLLKNSLVLRNDLNFDHLTCAELKDDEYPWKEIDMW